MLRPVVTGSADLHRLVERAEALAVAAERTDLVERLRGARSRLGGRLLRIGFSAGHGADMLAHLLRRVSTAWLPGASVAGVPGSPGGGAIPTPGSADVVLFVAEAREYGRLELDTLARLRDLEVPVLGILADHEACNDLTALQRACRQRLREADLDTPPIPLLPVSTAMYERGWRSGDEPLMIASGIPQLLEHVRDRVDTGVEARLREAVLHEVRATLDQVAPDWAEELRRLQADRGTPQERRRRATEELERRKRRSAAWQLSLGDGVTDLNAAVDFDLRERLREVLAFGEGELAAADPLADWEAFDAALRTRIESAATENYAVLEARADALGRRVAGELAGDDARSAAPVPSPSPSALVDDPATALRLIPSSDAPSGGGGMVSRLVNSVRGSYGGILMVGVLTSLAGERLISVYSVGAGILLGVYTFLEDRRTTRERRRTEGRAAVSKLLDAANFRLGDHQRAQLRRVQRAMRDHFSAVNDQRLRDAAEAVRAVAEVSDEEQEERAAVLEAHLAELVELRRDVGEPPRRRRAG